VAINVEGLVKRYGGDTAVDGIDLHVDSGEIVAFLGPNGAGKTTTIEILEGFRDRNAGRVDVLGQDPADAPLAWRERIGIVLQESEPIPELTAREAVAQQASYYSRPGHIDETLEIVGLTDSANQRTRKLSGGQKRRLDLALALIGDPELVFLDEPTTGFDPSARRESWGMIEALRQLGKTVLLTTHYMDEAERLADRIVVISGGRIAARGTAQELATQVKATTRIRWRTDSADPVPPPEFGVTIDANGEAVIETDNVTDALHGLTGWSLESGGRLTDLQVSRPTLEDVYLKLTESLVPPRTPQQAPSRNRRRRAP
jgi:ABC-2 type transport system ATP-binding protein